MSLKIPGKGVLETKEIFSRNYDTMCRLLEETGVGRRINIDNWRPTEPHSGTIPGVWDNENLTILATDGILGIFRRADGIRHELAHIQRFDGQVEPLGGGTKVGAKGTQKPAKPKKLSKKDKIFQMMEEL